MWEEGKMCIDEATLSELAGVQSKLEQAGVLTRDRSPSPIPGIQRALFQVLASENVYDVKDRDDPFL